MAVRTFALTYPQLMNQALAQGIDEEAIGRLHSAYEVAERWFDGFYRGPRSRRPFISHGMISGRIVGREPEVTKRRPPTTAA